MRDYMDRLYHLSDLPHLSGVPHLYVNRPLDSIKTKEKHWCKNRKTGCNFEPTDQCAADDFA